MPASARHPPSQPALFRAAGGLARATLSKAGRAVGLMLAGATAICAADGAVAGTSAPAHPLKVVSLDLAGVGGLEAAKAPAKPENSWRTSFGSERKSEPEVKGPDGPIDADVVLMQGVTSIRAVRKLFPANSWKLVVSRQMLASDDPLDPWSRDAVAGQPVTGVAVRFQEGLRVTGQEHLMALASATADGLALPRPPAGVAVRLQIGGGAMWLVSVDLKPLSCAPDEPRCKEPRALESWRRMKRESGEAVLVGGRVDIVETGPLPPPPCPGQALVLSPADGGHAEPRRTPAQYEEGSGCIARMTFGGG